MQAARWEPPLNDGIRDHTSRGTNERIDRTTRGTLDEVGTSPERVRARLSELDREWNVDRALMLNFAIVGGLSATMTARSLLRYGRPGGWGALLATQLAFLAHHAIRRWCPPMPLFRRLGFRSEREIEAERNMLREQLAT
ncbi:MAG: hypothetical protein SFX73_17985 [Kofleriaceae bacterium]|nr:hypothetical protein [Kofleriaceae bacterium]